jgi:hypothetical protein
VIAGLCVGQDFHNYLWIGFMYDIRRYRPGDENAIRMLFQRVFGAELTSEQWTWKYKNSLAHHALPMVATGPSGELVAHAGVLYLEGQYQGERIPFLQICDVMVAQEARGQLGNKNLFTRLVRKLFEQLYAQFPNAFNYGFPGRRPFLLGGYARAYGLVEHARETALQALRPNPWLRVERSVLVSSDLDRLWQRFRKHFALCLRRDQAYVHWRYAEHPTIDYHRVRFLIWGRIVGWAVLHTKAERTEVVDLFCHPRRLRQLLSALAYWLNIEKYPPAFVLLSDRWRQTIAGESQETELITASATWKFSFPTDEVRQSLFYTMGDVDIF